MTPRITTPAERTVLFLQRAIRSGAAAMIPGAFDLSARSVAPTPPSDRASAPSTATPETAVAAERERLEREREGGGAPSERGARRASVLARLWRSTRHPAYIPAIWSHVLPQP
jgi:hypothetical protein